MTDPDSRPFRRTPPRGERPARELRRDPDEKASTAEAEARESHWLRASIELAEALLANQRPAPALVAEHTTRAADADGVAIAVRNADGTLRIEAAAGVLAPLQGDRDVPIEGTLSEQVLRTGEAAVTVVNGSGRFGARLPALGPLVVLPLHGRTAAVGTIGVARRHGRPEFPRADLPLLAAFATHAGIALELDQARSAREALAAHEERERIATDLHEHVISELFRVGLMLDGLRSALAEQPGPRMRAEDAARRLDALVHDIRRDIFAVTHPSDLRGPPPAGGPRG